MSPQQKEWEGTTGGGPFGQLFLFWLLNKMKVSCIYPVLFLVVPFYFLFHYQGYRHIYIYFRRQHKQSKWKSFCSTYKNHYIFGKVVLDKFALLAGNHQQFNIYIEGKEHIDRMIAQEKGFILASAHVGNFELLGHSLQQNHKKINGIIFGGEAAKYQSQRIKALHKANIELIPVSDNLSHLFIIKEALDKGEIVSMPCDRLYGSTKHYLADFLGSKTAFPIGIFRIAAQLEVPVLTVFIMKEKGLNYRGYIYLLQALDNENSSVKKAEHLIKQYIDLLEKILKRYPEQWFNYYNFWKI
ncbi:MAG: lysophospholipid acyltransferase family protein [Bacteroidales bacterium]|jgi:predicted LPLAT superfamily acyltransferase|nr:lysophospholipid acyltransferase family protein [Bacteroidales bacterium]MDD2687297.1 lysophospholipid acyltransferase family protein [Bacteroidales bacterium]MDD3330895.1 lysophospholipid acyltransferase family protein [Bacteroidales bacterium]MDD3691856.1 lysophospholipid acyltransferase family protein [Bacteroidales bacterium]MDD4045389.1 lysophospholipid acyltransferase family protein [Bacteroidales bacterium]